MSLLLADAWLHTLDPFAIEFPAGWPVAGIRWYGLSYAAGFIIAWLLVWWMAKTDRSLIPAGKVGDLMTGIIVGVLVGGRVGYAVFYDPSLFITFQDAFPWWGLLAINRGGMASHGGILGVIIAGMYFAWRHRISPLHVVDVAALVATPGLLLGRLANFVNGELLGHPIPQSMQADPPWWSVKFPQEILLADYDNPHIKELGEIVGFDANLRYNVIEAVHRGNEQVITMLEPLLTPRYPSQLLQALTDGPILFAVLALIWLRPRRPGVVGAWFLITYGVLRIVTEGFRMPDEGVALLMDLSRGRVLSILMILAGGLVLVFLRHGGAHPVGGLIRRG